MKENLNIVIFMDLVFIIWKRNNNYKGEYENSLKHGYGIDYHTNGKLCCKGFWKNGNTSGFGVCYFQDGYLFYIEYLDN